MSESEFINLIIFYANNLLNLKIIKKQENTI